MARKTHAKHEQNSSNAADLDALIRSKMLKILNDPDAPAASQVAAAKELRRATTGEAGRALGSMTRADIEAELEECRAILGRTP